MTEEPKPYRVMIVDDSAVIRSIQKRLLMEDSNVRIVAFAENGQIAIDKLKEYPQIEIVVLDIEMPVMDGLTALPELVKINPDIQVIISSTLTRKNAEVSMKALQLGAKDYVLKPSTATEISTAEEFRTELVAKIEALAGAQRTSKGIPLPLEKATPVPAAPDAPKPSPAAKTDVAKTLAVARAKSAVPYSTDKINLRQPSAPILPKAIAIGSSTGGPQALFKVFEKLDKSIKQPIFLTQHMPATFTTILASHINNVGTVPCVEAQDGMNVEPGKAYLAPGDYHMLIEGSVVSPTIRLTQTPPENFCRPSVDPMLRSLVQLYEGALLTVILTGMGADGLEGSKMASQAGGQVIAQDAATSVVWGMPGAVANAGICSKILPVAEIGQTVNKMVAGV